MYRCFLFCSATGEVAYAHRVNGCMLLEHAVGADGMPKTLVTVRFHVARVAKFSVAVGGSWIS